MSLKKSMMLSLGNPPFPSISNLVARFSFRNAASLVITSGKVQQITDDIGSVVSSQATSASRPVYNATGGPNGKGIATFNYSQSLTGALLSTSTNFTMIVIRRSVNPSQFSQRGFFQNGNESSDGYGIIDYIGGGSATYGMSGGITQSIAFLKGFGAITEENRWEFRALSHSAGLTKVYNALHNFGVYSSSNPNTPTTGHKIGTAGGSPCGGDISDILLFDRQLSDLEVFELADYYTHILGLALPAQNCTGGDSRMTNTGGFPDCPTQLQASLLTAKYCYLNNTAMPSRTTVDVLNGLNTEVIQAYQSKVKDVYSIMIGYNDVAAATPAATIYNNIVSICQQVRAAGYKVVICTDMYSSNGTHNAVVDIYNASIRTNWATFADALCDLNALPQATQSNMGNPTYSGDGIHPTSVLAGFMAAALQTSISQFY